METEKVSVHSLHLSGVVYRSFRTLDRTIVSNEQPFRAYPIIHSLRRQWERTLRNNESLGFAFGENTRRAQQGNDLRQTFESGTQKERTKTADNQPFLRKKKENDAQSSKEPTFAVTAATVVPSRIRLTRTDLSFAKESLPYTLWRDRHASAENVSSCPKGQ